MNWTEYVRAALVGGSIGLGIAVAEQVVKVAWRAWRRWRP